MSSLAISVVVHPFDHYVLFLGAEVVIPDLNYSLKSSVCCVLIDLPINVIEFDIVSCRNYHIIVISATRKTCAGNVSSVGDLCANALHRPIKIGAHRLSVIEVVEYNYDVSSVEHRMNNIDVTIRSNTLDISIYNVNYYGSSINILAGNNVTVFTRIVYRYLYGNTNVSVLIKLNGISLLARGNSLVCKDRFHCINA